MVSRQAKRLHRKAIGRVLPASAAEPRPPSEPDRERGIVRRRIECIEEARRLRDATDPYPY